jgi:hypothetical protein
VASNLSGEEASFVVEEVPFRLLTLQAVNHVGNNKPNAMAALWALAHNTPCEPDYLQNICFGPPPNTTGQPITFGDYLFFTARDGQPGTRQGLENMLAQEAKDRLRIRRAGQGGVTNGPDLLRHEGVHTFQWLLLGDLFIPKYADEALKSLAATGNPACGNQLEIQANLYWGGYKRAAALGGGGVCGT